MIYSFCGKFELAQSVVQPKWAFGYLIIYMITIWDSYRLATYQNKIYDIDGSPGTVRPSYGKICICFVTSIAFKCLRCNKNLPHLCKQ